MAISFLSDLIDDVRLALDDPAVSKKWTDAQILRLGGMAFRRAFRDINVVSSHRVVLTHDISILSTTRLYELPPVVGEVVVWGEWNDDLGSYNWYVNSPSRYSPYRRGVHMDGKRIRFDANPQKAFTLRVEYIPGPHFFPHEGQIVFDNGAANYDNATSTTFPIVKKSLQTTTTVPRGTVIYYKDGFVGQVLKIWPDDTTDPQQIQERVIMSQGFQTLNAKEPLLTGDLAWDTTPGATETWNYEVLPWALEGFRQVVMLGTAMTLCAMSGLRLRKRDLTEEYMLAARTEKLYEAYYATTRDTWKVDTQEAFAAGDYP